MIGCRAAAGLSLLCALVCCAIAAPSAMAGTTAFTCSAAEAEIGFEDEHCDNAIKGITSVTFVHKSLPVNKVVEFKLTNETTKNLTTESEDFTLTGTLGGIAVEITCALAVGGGFLFNREEGAMFATGKTTFLLGECTVPKPQVGGKPRCLLEENQFEFNAEYITYENKGEMGLEFFPFEGEKILSEITFLENEKNKCPFGGPFKIEGSFKGTPGGTAQGRGATLKFTAGMSSMTLNGAALSMTGTLTLRKNEGSAIEDPIVFTTS